MKEFTFEPVNKEPDFWYVVGFSPQGVAFIAPWARRKDIERALKISPTPNDYLKNPPNYVKAIPLAQFAFENPSVVQPVRVNS